MPYLNSIDSSMDSPNAWIKIQDEQKSTSQAKFLLSHGKTPSKKSGKLNSEIRRLCEVAKVENTSNRLVVEKRPNKFSANVIHLTVIPSSHLPALLWQMHNSMNHPTKSQLKAQFDKCYYSVGLTPTLEKIYQDCFFCATQKKLPTQTHHTTKTETFAPGTYFHCDIIKRQNQKIMIVRDHFSSLSAAKIVRAETHQELKKGIIDLVLPIKKPGKCEIKVDNATGFLPLIEEKDHDLNKLNISIVMTDSLNKNENAVVDKACLEIEQELKRIEPDGRPISNTTLQIAVQQLNNKLRRHGQISSYEMHFNRDMNTGQNLNLDYDALRRDQIKTRQDQNNKHNEAIEKRKEDKLAPGDTVVVNHQYDKHKARDIFLISDANNKQVKMQKIIHPHTQEPKLRSKVYTTSIERVSKTRQFLQPPKPTKHFKKQNVNVQQINQESDSDSESEYAITTSKDDDATIAQCVHQENDQESVQETVQPPVDTPLYQVHERIQRKNACNAAPLYVALHQEYQNIQDEARASRKRAISEPTPPSPPSPFTTQSPPSRRKYMRKHKSLARLEISRTYGRIPQHDGPISLPASREQTPENESQKMSECFDSDIESIPWDYTEICNLTEDPIITGSVDYLSEDVQQSQIDNFSSHINLIHVDEDGELWFPYPPSIHDLLPLERGDADL